VGDIERGANPPARDAIALTGEVEVGDRDVELEPPAFA
jgi:hypothetical protein